jgi:lipopolysaccharide export system protein LptA
MCLTRNLLGFLLLMSTGAFALPSDNQAKIYIVADSAIYNYKTGVNVFEGHVKVDQATTHITADRLITKNNAQHKIQEAVAYGFQAQAHYWTLPKLTEPEIHAYAQIIRFFPIESNVTLEQNVQVTQGENSFHGQLIHYNNSNQTIIVPASKNGRSMLVYNPDK